MSQLREDLIAARAVIEKPEAWTRESWARDASGVNTMSSSQHAVCWCALGAVRKSIIAPDFGYHDDPNSDRVSAIDVALEKSLPSGFDDVPLFNDDPWTTHADILALFDRAIAASDLAAT